MTIRSSRSRFAARPIIGVIVHNSSVWIAIAGLASTALVGAAGIYFSYKSQRTPLRQILFERQLAVLSDFATTSSRLCKIAAALCELTSLSPEEQDEIAKHWDALSFELLQVTQRGSIVLPAGLYSALTGVRVCAEALEEALDKGEGVGKAYYELLGATAQAGMLAREVAGADALSAESLNLHSKDGYQALSSASSQGFARVVRHLWGPRRKISRD